MDNQTKRSGEVDGATHLIILSAYTISALILITEVLVMDWEKIFVPINIVMILYAWYLNLMQKYSGVQRVTLYAVFLVFTYFVYGIHTYDLGVQSLAVIVIMLVFSTTKIRGLIWMAAATYAFAILYDLSSNQGHFEDVYGLSEMQFLFQFLMVFLVVFVTHILTTESETVREELQSEMEELQEKSDLAEGQTRIVAKELGKLNRTIGGELLLLKQSLQEKQQDPESLKEMDRIISMQYAYDSKIADLEDFAQMAAGKTQIHQEAYEIMDLVAQLRQELRHIVGENKPELLLDLDPMFPKVMYGDRQKLSKILAHLIENGIRYTREGAVYLRIFPRFYGDGCNLCIEVQDTGMGIDRKDLELLLEQIENRETASYRPGGLGLGLYLVSGFVRQMGGFFHMESEWGRGTKVSVSIPQRVADAVPCMAFDRKNEVCIALEDRFYFFPEVDQFFEEIYQNFTEKLGISAYYVKTDEELRELSNSYCKVVMLLDDMSYLEDPEYFESLDIFLVVVSKEEIELPEGSHATLLTGPFGTPEILHVLEAAKKTIHRRRREDAEPAQEEKPELWVESLEQRNIRIHGGRKYMIVTDSMADLPAEISRERGIPIIPFRIFAERGSFLDGLEMSQECALSYFKENPSMHSMAPDEEEFRKFFENNLRYAEHLIYIATARRVSVAYDRARKVALDMPNVTVFNSGQVSGGTALMALMADDQIRKGVELDELMLYLEKLRPRVKTSFLIENLDHLAYVGRVSKGVGLFAKTFMLHPVMVMRHDAMKVGAVRFGNLNNAKAFYLHRILKKKDEIDLSHVFVGSVGVPQKELLGLEHRLSEEGEFRNVILKRASAAISINCGVGTFGIIYVKNNGELG